MKNAVNEGWQSDSKAIVAVPSPAPLAPATLADPRPGDEVAIVGRYGVELAKVDRITPTGRFVVGGSQYAPNGSRMGNRDSWSHVWLAIPTDGHRAKVLRATARSRWSSLERSGKVPSLPSLARLVSALEAIEAEATQGG